MVEVSAEFFAGIVVVSCFALAYGMVGYFFLVKEMRPERTAYKLLFFILWMTQVSAIVWGIWQIGLGFQQSGAL